MRVLVRACVVRCDAMQDRAGCGQLQQRVTLWMSFCCRGTRPVGASSAALSAPTLASAAMATLCSTAPCFTATAMVALIVSAVGATDVATNGTQQAWCMAWTGAVGGGAPPPRDGCRQ